MSVNNYIKADKYCLRVTDGTHDSPSQTKSGKRLITSRHLKQFSLDFDNAYLISLEDYNDIIKRSKVDKWDILISMIGTVGLIYQEKSEKIDYAIKNIGLFKLGGDQLKSKWLYYYLQTPDAIEYIVKFKRGSTQQYLPLNTLRSFPIRVLPYEVQYHITSVLSSLDDKIELNNRMNKTLEEIAQTLFKRWFVDFEFPDENGNPYKSSGGKMVESELGSIPKGWNVVSIKELIEDYIGGDWGKDKPTEEFSTPMSCIRGADFPAVQSGNISDLPLRYVKESSMHRRRLENEDIVLEISGGTKGRPVGRTVYINHALITKLDYPVSFSNFCRLVRCKRPFGLMVYQYIQMKYFDGEIEQYQLQSTGIANFQFNSFLENFKIISSNVKTAYQFSNIAGPLFERLQMNDSKILSQIRDTLLPKLMSGEIRVTDN